MIQTEAEPVESSPLHGRRLVVVRFVWTLITLLVIALVVTGIPVRYAMVRGVDPTLRGPEFRDLIRAGVSPDVAAAGDLASGTLVFVSLLVGGVLLFIRAQNSREAVFLSLTLILFGAGFPGLTSVHRSIGPPWAQSPVGLLTTVLLFLQSSATWIAPFWLPEGRFTSRWTAWVAALATLAAAGLYFLVSFPRSHDFVNIVALPIVAAGVCSQVSRYRRVVNPVTRQQIKWAVIGIVVASLGFLLWQTTFLLVGGRTGLTARIVMVGARTIMSVSQVVLMVCFVIAIQKFRLWHVDVLINRSLVYGAVTVLLAVVFLGGGFILQGVLGQENAPIAFAISIAAAAFLFSPARNHAQRFVDRRLYGFRFDLNELNRAQHSAEIKNPGALTGRTLGNYRILGVLGKGGMGEVYQAQRDGKVVAIKILPDDLGRQADFRKWFERESKTLAAFDHPNIVRFHECGDSNGLSYMVLDFIDGRELSAILKERGPLPLQKVRMLLKDVAAALDYAHQRGLIHRDIKPANIMIRRRDGRDTCEAVLMDFGIAKLNDARTVLTSTGAVGTISYMAPEQIMATRTVDHRADIYAVGVMVYEMLTGELPFKGNPAQVLFSHLQQRPAAPDELVAGLPAKVAHSVMKALEKRPEDRYQSVGEFAMAMSRA